jgi:hypothetical protein
MADRNKLQQMLECLVNGEQAKAEELFHEYVVEQSREIYETLIESEIADEEVDEATDENEDEDEVKEASDEDKDEDELEENFEDVAFEGDDEEGPMGDMTGDLAGELDGEEGEEGPEEEKSEEELFMDLDAIVDELQAKFDELKGEEGGEGEFGGEEKMGDAFEPELATVREYVEKVANGHGAEKKGAGEGALVGTGNKGQGSSTSAKSIVAGKNDMGGTTANILNAKEDTSAGYVGQPGGAVKGSALSDTKPQDLKSGNINVPGGKAGGAFSTKEPGHGAEKKGDAPGKMAGAGTGEMGGQKGEQSTTSLFRGRR